VNVCVCVYCVCDMGACVLCVCVCVLYVSVWCVMFVLCVSVWCVCVCLCMCVVFFVCKSVGNGPFGRPRRRWEDNIKIDLQETGRVAMDWIDMAQDMDGWRTRVSAAII